MLYLPQSTLEENTDEVMKIISNFYDIVFLKFQLVQLQVLLEFRHLSGKKCAIELAVPLQMLFIQSLESGIIPECLKRELQLFQLIRVVINHYHLITAQYLSLQS